MLSPLPPAPPSDLRAFSPSPAPGPLLGPAYPVLMVPYADTTSPRPSQHFVDACPPDHIIVVSAPKEARNACWGGLMTLGAKGRGALGVVVNGRVRDVGEHQREGFPVGVESLCQSLPSFFRR